MKNLSIRIRLIFLVMIAVLLLIAVGVLGVRGMGLAEEALQRLFGEELIPFQELTKINTLTLENGYLLAAIEARRKVEIVGKEIVSTVDRDVLATDAALINANTEKINALWEAYSKINASPEEKKLAEAYYTKRLAFRDNVLIPALAAFEAGDVDIASALIDEKMEKYRNEAAEAMETLLLLKIEMGKGEYNQSQREYQEVRIETIGLILAGLALLCFIAFFTIRSIIGRTNTAYGYLKQMVDGDLNIEMKMEVQDEVTKILLAVSQLRNKLTDDVAVANATSDNLKTLIGQIQASTLQVSNSITEIAATTKQQEATSIEVSATTTEISATSKEISATARELVKTMTEVSATSEQTASLAASGQAGLVHMEDTMQQVMAAVGSINAKLAVLNEKATNINQVTTTINKVADQTNLLSLNAAIEAEKAGEFGRGFAIVATEIRRLADQTAVATYDIELMVKEIQSAVSASVMGMDKFSEEVRRGLTEVQQVSSNLTQVIEQVQTLAPRFEGVNEGMQTQAMSAEQITESLAQLSDAVQQTVDSLRQSSQGVAEVNQAMHDLSSSVAAHT